MITPRQIRAARGLVNWTVNDLAGASGLACRTLNNFENEKAQTRSMTADIIAKTFDKAGVEFTENEGVRMKSLETETFVGIDRFQEFMEYVYKMLRGRGGEFCISITDERRLQDCFRDIDHHRTMMSKLVNECGVSGRILAADGDFKKTWAELRRRPKIADMKQVSFFTFGGCLAQISLEHNPSPYVVLHKVGPFAGEYMDAFNAAWERAEKI